jgi:hypothetical protein
VKKLFYRNNKLFSLLIVFGLLIGYSRNGHAQSVQEWSDPVNVSMSGAASNPAIVVDGNGVIHVIWVDKFDGYKYSQSADGITWTSPETVKYPFSPKASPPMLFSDVKGNIHIFWLSDKNKLSYAQTLPENLDSPTSWKLRKDLDSSVLNFDAKMDAQGQMQLTYIKNPAPDAGVAGVYHLRSPDGGRNWDSGTLLYVSPYFRSLTPQDARVRMAVSDKTGEDRVYIVWDDQPQKRIFISISADGGLTWKPVKELMAPQANLGYQAPYHADIDVLDDKVLASWFVGAAGGRCTPYSWSSSDGGETWGEQVPIFSGSTQCPEQSGFLSIDPKYSVEDFLVQGNLSISAWNGTEWSNPEIQTGPSSITNPATFEPVVLGCEQVTPYQDRLYVVGCDEGSGGDIWFLSRKLEPLNTLFPLPSEWSGDTMITSVPRTISSLSSIADETGNIHAFWIQTPNLSTDVSAPVIQYARWNGKEWSNPLPILTGLEASPKSFALQIDNQQRLLLSWVDWETGELMFSWSNSERANIPSEWKQPISVSTSSSQINSPDMIVDAGNRIVVAYAITLNEGRGIYVIQSSDLGETWSAPTKVLDAVGENWDMVDQPKLAVTDDGTLHILFTRYKLLGEPQPVGVYYSQSKDGGVTWTSAEPVSEQPVQWSELVAFQGVLHRLWQEKNKSTARTNHQVSTDSGKTWGAADNIPGDEDINSRPSVFIDGTGSLHYVHVTDQGYQVFEEWEWSDGHWNLIEDRKVAAFELNSPPQVESGITSTGRIYALLQFEKMLKDEIRTDISSISRSSGITSPTAPNSVIISTPPAFTIPTPVQDLQPTASPVSPLDGLNDPQPKSMRNIIGLILVMLVAVFLLVFLLPRRSKLK